MNIGTTIKARREKLGITQRELAARMRISETYVSRLERGMHYPGMVQLRRLSEALDVSIDDLVPAAPKE